MTERRLNADNNHNNSNSNSSSSSSSNNNNTTYTPPLAALLGVHGQALVHLSPRLVVAEQQQLGVARLKLLPLRPGDLAQLAPRRLGLGELLFQRLERLDARKECLSRRLEPLVQGLAGLVGTLQLLPPQLLVLLHRLEPRLQVVPAVCVCVRACVRVRVCVVCV